MSDDDVRPARWMAGSARDARGPWRPPTWRATLPLAAALALGLGTLLLIRLIARPLGFLIIAIAIAEGLQPPVAWLERWMPRAAAIALVYLALIALLVGAGWLIAPALIAQGQELALRAPELFARVRRMVETGDRVTGGQLAVALGSMGQQVMAFVVSLPFWLLRTVIDVFVVGFLSIYWLIGAPALERFALSLLPEHRRDRAQGVLEQMGRAMGGYVRGAAINAVVMGALAWLGLWLIGVNYALTLGVLTMLGEPVPIIGPILVAIPVVIVALLQSPTTALLALGLYVVLQQVEGQLLTPNIMRGQTDVPQTLVIFAIVAGGAIGGLLGVLVSIPLAAALRVFVLQVLVPAIRRWTGARRAAPTPEPAEG